MNDFADARPPAKRVHISRNVEKAGGEPDSDSIREALKIVLKRHPDFKSKEQKGGIKLGAPNEEKQPANEKALPHGKVIF